MNKTSVNHLKNDISSFHWKCKHTWRRSAKNTAWCLVGCSIGDFGTILYFQLTGIPWSTLSIMILAIFNGIIKKGMSKKMVMKCDQLSSRGPALKKDNEWYYNKATASFGFDTILQFQGDVVDKVKNPKDVDGIWLDMTKQELNLACGKPDKKGNKSVSRAKVTEIWKFFGRTNRQNTTSYKWEVRLVNDIVDSWKELE